MTPLQIKDFLKETDPIKLIHQVNDLWKGSTKLEKRRLNTSFVFEGHLDSEKQKDVTFDQILIKTITQSALKDFVEKCEGSYLRIAVPVKQ